MEIVKSPLNPKADIAMNLKEIWPDLFGLIVRVCGLIFVLNGSWYLLSGLGMTTNSLMLYGSFTWDSNLVMGIFTTAGGLFLMRKAKVIVGFAYPEIRNQFEDDE